MFELDDEYAESDIPTTLIRSKADCPTMEVSTHVLMYMYGIVLTMQCAYIYVVLHVYVHVRSCNTV